MKRTRTFPVIATIAAGLICTVSTSAQVTVWVDMDPLTPGIQDTLNAVAGQTFTADVGITVGAAGVSSYSISAQLDTAELSLNGVTPAANNPALPGGLSSLFGAPTWNLALGSVHGFNGATLGSGPVSTSFVIGSIDMKASAPIGDGLADVTPGLFNLGIDGLFNNAGGAVTPTLQSGFIAVPEPRTTALFMAAAAFVSVSWFRRVASQRDRRCGLPL